MCGICGILGENPQRSIDRMVSAMRHRGPDDSGILREDGIALGMTRLAVIDLSPNAHQPMSNAEGTIWIVYNGETYNFREEREVLVKKGHTFKSSSDTEVVLRMYEVYGDDFLIRMRGMFALAIYDKRRGPDRKRLLLARDPLGIKPILYGRRDSTFLFASEMKAILASGLVERRFDPEGLRLLISYGSITQPNTAVQGVKMLLPGHRLIIESGEERIERFWKLDIDRIQDLRKRSYEDQVRMVRETLQESVRMQMVSDVPIGAFLSGGVDSTLVVALMAQASNTNIKTFSVGFEQEGREIDETDDAERVAKLIGTDHRRVLVTGQDFRDRVSHIASALDQPSVDGVNSYFISMAARRGVTVAISGTGGDELFAGYPWFVNMLAMSNRTEGSSFKSYLLKIFSPLTRHGLFDAAMSSRLGPALEHMRSISSFVARYSRQHQIFGPLGAERVLAPEVRESASVGREPSRDMASADELSYGSTIERVSGLCLRTYTQNQLLRDIDAVSMAHSLEIRVPYLDTVVTDTALSLPDNAKVGDIRGISDLSEATYRETGAKRILIDAGCGLLPEGMDLQKKRGFGMPFDSWLKNSLHDVLEDTLSSEVVKKRGYFCAEEVEGIRRRFMAGEISWVFPWLLIVTELWCREILDRTRCHIDKR
jgi:asparagine synthase (glutamine-hydrolysing)